MLINQDTILTQLGKYLKFIKDYDNEKGIYLSRELKFIEEIAKSGGCCVAFTTLMMHAEVLQEEPITVDQQGVMKPRDDLKWLMGTLSDISKWDGISPLTQEQKANFDRFIHLIYSIQNISRIQNISYGNIEKLLEDTKNRRYYKEKSIAGCFKREEIKNILLRVLETGKVIYISSCDHIIGVYLRKVGTKIFYDSNNFFGSEEFQAVDQLVDLILKALDYTSNDPFASIAIRSYSVGTKAPEVESQTQKILQECLPVGENVLRRADRFGRGELHISAHVSCVDSLQYYLSMNKDSDYVDVRDINDNTPLIIASEQHTVETIIMLLEAGATEDLYNRDNRSALLNAIRYNNLENVEALLDGDADVNLRLPNGTTPIIAAAISKNYAAARLLVKQKADVNFVCLGGITALNIAVRLSDVAMVKLLLKHGAKQEFDFAAMQIREYSTPLILAVRAKNFEMVRVLCEAGADINAQDSSGDTALHHAIKEKSAYLVKMLLLKSPDLSIKNHKNQDLFMLARESKNAEIIVTLHAESMARKKVQVAKSVLKNNFSSANTSLSSTRDTKERKRKPDGQAVDKENQFHDAQPGLKFFEKREKKSRVVKVPSILEQSAVKSLNI